MIFQRMKLISEVFSGKTHLDIFYQHHIENLLLKRVSARPFIAVNMIKYAVAARIDVANLLDPEEKSEYCTSLLNCHKAVKIVDKVNSLKSELHLMFGIYHLLVLILHLVMIGHHIVM